MEMSWGWSNSPGPVPVRPHVLMNRPSFENFTTRSLRPWPSVTKMSPLGATATPVGRLNVSGPFPAAPAWPIVISTSPRRLSLNTWWPIGSPAKGPPAARAGIPSTVSSPFASVAHTCPSGSTVKPWGKANIPPPRLASSRPDGANCRIGGSERPTQVAAPAGTVLKQRWKIQMLPSGSSCARISSPQRPPFISGGSVGQLSTSRYGFGSWSCPLPWACTDCAAMPTAASTATTTASMPSAMARKSSEVMSLALRSVRLVRRVSRSIRSASHTIRIEPP